MLVGLHQLMRDTLQQVTTMQIGIKRNRGSKTRNSSFLLVTWQRTMIVRQRAEPTSAEFSIARGVPLVFPLAEQLPARVLLSRCRLLLRQHR